LRHCVVGCFGFAGPLSALCDGPAFGSGPLATVIQDLLSILIYFGVALAMVD
jgi:magnesium transporter